MAYNKTTWENLPSTNTPINETNLNKIEDELEDLDIGVDFENQITFSETQTNNCEFVKKGNMVFIRYQGESKAHSANDVLFTIPNGYRPAKASFVPFIQNNNTYGVIQILSSGVCSVSQISSSTNTGRIYFTAFYSL